MYKVLMALVMVFSVSSFAKKPEGDGGKACRQEIKKQIKVLQKQMKACKTKPAPEPEPEEPLVK